VSAREPEKKTNPKKRTRRRGGMRLLRYYIEHLWLPSASPVRRDKKIMVKIKRRKKKYIKMDKHTKLGPSMREREKEQEEEETNHWMLCIRY
jgi:hypothetical protein